MARSYWRDWELIRCSKCSWHDYIKNFRKRKEHIPEICPNCKHKTEKPKL